MKDWVKILIAVVIFVALIVFCPFILIWAINTLLEQASVSNQIQYNIWS